MECVVFDMVVVGCVVEDGDVVIMMVEVEVIENVWVLVKGENVLVFIEEVVVEGLEVVKLFIVELVCVQCELADCAINILLIFLIYFDY